METNDLLEQLRIGKHRGRTALGPGRRNRLEDRVQSHWGVNHTRFQHSVPWSPARSSVCGALMCAGCTECAWKDGLPPAEVQAEQVLARTQVCQV